MRKLGLILLEPTRERSRIEKHPSGAEARNQILAPCGTTEVVPFRRNFNVAHDPMRRIASAALH
jgi:hypothetical protein